MRVMEKESGMILDWFYEYFVQTTKTIDYGITSVTGDETNTTVEVSRNGLMPMPLDIVVEYDDGTSEMFYIPLRIMRGEKPAENDMKRNTLKDWAWVNPTYSFDIPTSRFNIKSITIDPSQRLADVDPSNNTIEPEETTDN